MLNIEKNNDSLSHFGVIGMRWGKTKKSTFSESTATSSKKKMDPKTKKRIIYGSIAIAVGVVATTAILARPALIKNLQNKKTADLLISELKDSPKYSDFISAGKKTVDGQILGDVHLPLGTKFHRVATTFENSINKPKYATYLDNDVLKYRSSFDWNSNSKVKSYKTTFEALQKVKIAGETSMADAVRAVAKTDSKMNGKLRGEIISAYKGQSSYNIMKEEFKNASTQEVVKRWIDLNSGGSWNSPMAKQVRDTLKKSGYSAFTDSIDSRGLAGHAVVLINDEALKTTGSILTNVEKEAAKKLLTKAEQLLYN